MLKEIPAVSSSIALSHTQKFEPLLLPSTGLFSSPQPTASGMIRMSPKPFMRYATKFAKFLSKALEHARGTQARLDRKALALEKSLGQTTAACVKQRQELGSIVQSLKVNEEIYKRGKRVRDTLRDTVELIREIDAKLPPHLHFHE